MIRLSAFADEISPDLAEQIAVLNSEQIHYLDLRSVRNINVLDLTDQQVDIIRKTLDEHGIGVAALGSPLGKVPIDSPFEDHLQKLERAITLAHALRTRYIRVFSFYPPTSIQTKGEEGKVADPASYRDEVLRRLREMTARARAANIVLLHENEKEIYGDSIARNLDVLQNINDAYFRAVLDPANYIQCQQQPYPQAYDAVLPWLEYVHVKDALADGQVVAAGEGGADWPSILRRLRNDNYRGFLSLEPHLASAGKYQGFSGPDLFRQASQALQKLLKGLGWDYA